VYSGKYLQLIDVVAGKCWLLRELKLVLMKYDHCGVISHSSEILAAEVTVVHPNHFGQCLMMAFELSVH
jgi:hypothetical protein